MTSSTKECALRVLMFNSAKFQHRLNPMTRITIKRVSMHKSNNGPSGKKICNLAVYCNLAVLYACKNCLLKWNLLHVTSWSYKIFLRLTFQTQALFHQISKQQDIFHTIISWEYSWEHFSNKGNDRSPESNVPRSNVRNSQRSDLDEIRTRRRFYACPRYLQV